MQGLGSTQPRAPPRPQLQDRRSCQGATQGRASAPLTTAFSTPPATPEGCARPVPLVRLGFPAGRVPFRLHATETPRSQMPPRPGSTSPFTRPHLSNNCPASPQAGKEGRPIPNAQAYLTLILNGRSRTPRAPTTWPRAHWLDTRLGPRLKRLCARIPGSAAAPNCAAFRLAARALGLSRALWRGQWGYSQSRSRHCRSGGAAVSSEAVLISDFGEG